MKIEIDTDRDVIYVDGIGYALAIFQALSNLPVGTKLEILERSNEKVVVKQHPPEIDKWR